MRTKPINEVVNTGTMGGTTPVDARTIRRVERTMLRHFGPETRWQRHIRKSPFGSGWIPQNLMLLSTVPIILVFLPEGTFRTVALISWMVVFATVLLLRAVPYIALVRDLIRGEGPTIDADVRQTAYGVLADRIAYLPDTTDAELDAIIDTLPEPTPGIWRLRSRLSRWSMDTHNRRADICRARYR